MTARQAAAATVVVVVAASAPLTGWAPFGRGRTGVPAGQSEVTFTGTSHRSSSARARFVSSTEGIAPFPCLTYDESKSHASAIVAATRDRVMPPWKPEPGYGQFADERRLSRRSDRDARSMGRRWSRSKATAPRCRRCRPGAASGSSENPISCCENRLTRCGRLWRRCVSELRATDRRATETRYVRAWQFRPVFSGRASRDDAWIRPLVAPPGRAGSRAGLRRSRFRIPGGSPEGFFLGWLPGHMPYAAPRGNGWPLPHGPIWL